MRLLLKRVIQGLSVLAVLPLYLLYQISGSVFNRDASFQGCSQALCLIPGKSGIFLRAAFYRLSCERTSQDISIGFLTVLSHHNITIGKGVYIGPQCNIGLCEIGENTLIGSGVHIVSGKRQHQFSDLAIPIKEQGGHFEKVYVGADCWLGNQALLLAGVGDQSVVAAGSVVTTEIPPRSIVAGNPAKTIGSRDNGKH